MATFMNAVVPLVLVCWMIWTARNDLIFKELQLKVLDYKFLFLKELSFF